MKQQIDVKQKTQTIMSFIYVLLIGIVVIAYIDAIVVIIKEAKERDGADPFTAGLFCNIPLTAYGLSVSSVI